MDGVPLKFCLDQQELLQTSRFLLQTIQLVAVPPLAVENCLVVTTGLEELMASNLGMMNEVRLSKVLVKPSINTLLKRTRNDNEGEDCRSVARTIPGSASHFYSGPEQARVRDLLIHFDHRPGTRNGHQLLAKRKCMLLPA